MTEWDDFRAWIERIANPKGLAIWEPDPAKNETDDGVRAGRPTRSQTLEFSQVVFEHFSILAEILLIHTPGYVINETDVKKIINLFNGRNKYDYNNISLETYTWPSHTGGWAFYHARIINNDFLRFPEIFNKPGRGRPNHDFSPNRNLAIWFSLFWHLILIWKHGNAKARKEANELVIYWLKELPKPLDKQVSYSDSAYGVPKQKMLKGSEREEPQTSGPVPLPHQASTYSAYASGQSFKKPKGLTSLTTCDSWVLWLLGRIDLCHLNQHGNPPMGPLKLDDIDLKPGAAPVGCSLVTDPVLNKELHNAYNAMATNIRGIYDGLLSKLQKKQEDEDKAIDYFISRTDKKQMITRIEELCFEKLVNHASANLIRHPMCHWFKYFRI